MRCLEVYALAGCIIPAWRRGRRSSSAQMRSMIYCFPRRLTGGQRDCLHSNLCSKTLIRIPCWVGGQRATGAFRHQNSNVATFMLIKRKLVEKHQYLHNNRTVCAGSFKRSPCIMMQNVHVGWFWINTLCCLGSKCPTTTGKARSIGGSQSAWRRTPRLQLTH